MAEWKRRFWKNAASSYASVAVRMLLGLVLFREMFGGLDAAEFGFWALLWSLFGYGVLLDFGFGFTAQKAVAEKSAAGDFEGMSRLLATIFWTFVVLGLVLMTVMLSLQGPFLAGVDVEGGHEAEFRAAYLVFFIGMGLMFPLGLFAEILRGLQRIDLANWSSVVSTVLNFIGLVWGLRAGWSFPVLMGVSIGTTALPGLVAVAMVRRLLPRLSLAPRWFEWRAVRSQMGFSVVAYLITFSNLLMAKSDQMVIGLVVGVAGVTIYQAGYKMAEMLNLFAVQLQAGLAPAAADLRARGSEEGLVELLLRSSRLNLVMVLPGYLLAAVYLEPLIRLLTGLEAVPAETWWVGQLLLAAVLSAQLTSGSAKRVLMMCGEERKLLWTSVGDAVFNVGLSVGLAYGLGVLGVAWGTLVPTVLVGWLVVVPLTLRCLKLGWGRFAGAHLEGTWMPLLALGAGVAALAWWLPVEEGTSGLALLGGLAWRAALVGVPYLWLVWPVVRSITR